MLRSRLGGGLSGITRLCLPVFVLAPPRAPGHNAACKAGALACALGSEFLFFRLLVNCAEAHSPAYLDAKDKLLERHALHLGGLGRRTHHRVAVAAVQVQRHAWSHAPRAAPPLSRVGAAHLRTNERTNRGELMERIDRRTNGQTDERMDERTKEWANGRARCEAAETAETREVNRKRAFCF